jgi:hypothetical protein
MRPGRPSVLLQRTTTRIFRAAMTRSMLDISLVTPATISGVSPGDTAAMSSPVVRSSSSHSRSRPTVHDFTRA